MACCFDLGRMCGCCHARLWLRAAIGLTSVIALSMLHRLTWPCVHRAIVRRWFETSVRRALQCPGRLHEMQSTLSNKSLLLPRTAYSDPFTSSSWKH